MLIASFDIIVNDGVGTVIKINVRHQALILLYATGRSHAVFHERQ